MIDLCMKGNFVQYQINRISVITNLVWFRLKRFRENFSCVHVDHVLLFFNAKHINSSLFLQNDSLINWPQLWSPSQISRKRLGLLVKEYMSDKNRLPKSHFSKWIWSAFQWSNLFPEWIIQGVPNHFANVKIQKSIQNVKKIWKYLLIPHH